MKHANVAIFVPHSGCPNDCSFCNQRSISGSRCAPQPSEVAVLCQNALDRMGTAVWSAEIAFFGGSFTAIERGMMISLLEAAFPFVGESRFAGIRISTRPDAIDEEVLQILKRYGVTAIELGAQSMDDRVLAHNRRGHTAQHVRNASRLIKRHGFSLGLQMMTGLPLDTDQGAMQTAEELLLLEPDTVRIYPTLVVGGTQIEKWFREGAYRPEPLEEAIRLCAGLLVLFEENRVPVIRLGLHAQKELEQDLVAGPYHPAFRELCESRLMLARLCNLLGKSSSPTGYTTVYVHPKSVSKMVGQSRENMKKLSDLGIVIKIKVDEQLGRYEIKI